MFRATTLITLGVLTVSTSCFASGNGGGHEPGLVKDLLLKDCSTKVEERLLVLKSATSEIDKELIYDELYEAYPSKGSEFIKACFELGVSNYEDQ